MELHCFTVSHGKITNKPLCLAKYGKTQKCVLLATKIDDNDSCYYKEISNNWHASNKLDEFKLMHMFQF